MMFTFHRYYGSPNDNTGTYDALNNNSIQNRDFTTPNSVTVIPVKKSPEVVYRPESKAEKSDEIIDNTETEIFQNVIERAHRSEKTCAHLKPEHPDELKIREPITDVPFLPEFGIASFLEKALTGHEAPEWGQCSLPPATSCDLDQVSVIMMAYNEDGLYTIKSNIISGGQKLYPRRIIDEIILVWNGPDRASLEESPSGKILLKWRDEGKIPLRLFICAEHGLGNNLLNRYHPLIQPKNEAILFFDDDGPYFFEHTVEAGFELWKRNSGRQIGCMARHFEAQNSERQLKLHMEAMGIAIDEVLEGRQTATYNINSDAQQPFIPHCRSHDGDNVRYNYNSFSNFHAQMVLPSGSFLHRNFLCFIWHPAFEELRQFVLAHKTHPDDITVSTIVSQVTGRAPRVYTRRMHKRNAKDVQGDKIVDKKDNLVAPIVMLPPKQRDEERRLLDASFISDTNGEFDGHEYSFEVENIFVTEKDAEEYEKYMFERVVRMGGDEEQHLRRRLLWNNDDWGNLREDALNSIVGYFGSFNGGSVGWCLTTKFHTKTAKEHLHWCEPEISGLDWAPWVNEGGVGYDECPVTPYARLSSSSHATSLIAEASYKKFESILK